MAEVVTILGKPTERAKALAWVKRAPEGTAVVFKKATRSLKQNRLLHDLCADISRQVVWQGRKLDIEAWKDILTAAYLSSKHRLEVVPGIDGGFVMLGMHTSSMSVQECSDLIELAFAFGAQHGVVFQDQQQRDGARGQPAADAA